jgi:hypothetical protein
MTQAMRTTLTLLILGVVLAVAAAWGWNSAMKPLPAKVDSAACVSTRVAAGEKVYPQQVTVSVYNAGRREGLAGRTMQLLKDQGFAQGKSGNARGARIATAAIWTTEPDDPDVRLVATYFGAGVQIERRDGPGVGVSVVVGDRFTTLVKGQAAVVAEKAGEICSPPVN